MKLEPGDFARMLNVRLDVDELEDLLEAIDLHPAHMKVILNQLINDKRNPAPHA